MTLYHIESKIQKLKSYDDCVKLLKCLNSQRGVDAVVAGGWVRDKLNGIDPKDIDIFVMNGTPSVVKSALDVGGYYHEVPLYYANYEKCDMRDDVKSVLKYKGYDLDIIFMQHDDVEGVIKNFDVSICQIWARLEGDDLVVYASRDYLDWVDNGVIYQYTDIPTQDDHLDRVREKFGVEFIPKLSGEMVIVKLGVLNE